MAEIHGSEAPTYAEKRIALSRKSRLANLPEFTTINGHLDQRTLQLFIAVFNNDRPAVERSLTKGLFSRPADIQKWARSTIGSSGSDLTVTRAAIECADYGLVQTLISKGSPTSVSEFEAAVELGRADVARLLLDRGVKLDAEARARAMVKAAENGDTAVLTLLLAVGGDSNAKTKDGALPIGHAIRSGELPAVELLVQSGAHANGDDLCNAIFWGRYPIAEHLLTHAVDVNAALTGMYKESGTALNWAVARGNVAAVELLLSHGADPSRPDEKGRTALQVAFGTLTHPLHPVAVPADARKRIVELLAASGVEVPAAKDCHHDFAEPDYVDATNHIRRCVNCGDEIQQPHQMQRDYCLEHPFCSDGCGEDEVCVGCHYRVRGAHRAA